VKRTRDSPANNTTNGDNYNSNRKSIIVDKDQLDRLTEVLDKTKSGKKAKGDKLNKAAESFKDVDEDDSGYLGDSFTSTI